MIVAQGRDVVPRVGMRLGWNCARKSRNIRGGSGSGSAFIWIDVFGGKGAGEEAQEGERVE